MSQVHFRVTPYYVSVANVDSDVLPCVYRALTLWFDPRGWKRSREHRHYHGVCAHRLNLGPIDYEWGTPA